MEHVRPLPVREALQPGESLASLVRRHAVAMGYENLHRLLEDLPLSRRAPALNSLATDSVLEPLGVLLRQSGERLRGATVHRFTHQLSLVPREVPPPALCDSKTALRFWTTAGSPVCPLCFQTDPAYERLLWSFRPLPFCREHGCFLHAACSFCGRAFRPERLDVRRCRCGADVSTLPVLPIPTLAQSLTESISEWLLQGKLPLPGLTVAAGFWWVDRLASAVGRTPSWLTAQRERWSVSAEVPEESLSWLAAADLLRDWPRRFEAFLDVFQTVTRHRHAVTGVSRGFGRLLREAQHLERKGFPGPADALRSYLLTRYSRGHLNAMVCLFRDPLHRERLTDRAWMSQTEAARPLGLRQGAVAELVQRGILTGQIAAVGIHGRSVGLVARESVMRLREELTSALTVPEAAGRLGLSRDRVIELIREGLLPRCVHTHQGWKIPTASFEAVRRLLDALPFETAPAADAIDLKEAMRRFSRRGLTLVRLLNAIGEGHVPAVRMVDSSGVRGVRIRVSDLQKLLTAVPHARQSEEASPIPSLAARLFSGRPLQHSLLRRWIQAGLLTAHRIGRRWQIPPDEVDRFQARYCLADEACRLLGIHRRTLSRWEAEGRIAAVYGRRTTAGVRTSVFHRADVESLRTADSWS
ncbi:MAG: TniQ family protein [Planctomycetaceae bacterium]|nr:TniQ family protein [Planctomycetaceae bacterium]